MEWIILLAIWIGPKIQKWAKWAAAFLSPMFSSKIYIGPLQCREEPINQPDARNGWRMGFDGRKWGEVIKNQPPAKTKAANYWGKCPKKHDDIPFAFLICSRDWRSFFNWPIINCSFFIHHWEIFFWEMWMGKAPLVNKKNIQNNHKLI